MSAGSNARATPSGRMLRRVHRSLEVGERQLQPSSKINLWLPIENPLGFADIGAPSLWIILGQWLELHNALRPRYLNHKSGAFQHREFYEGALHII